MPVYHICSKQFSLSFSNESLFEEKYLREGDPLIEIKKLMNFEKYRDLLEKAVAKHSSRRTQSRAGRPSWDPVFILKCLFLQTKYGLSLAKTRTMIIRDLGFRHFLDIVDPADIPDDKTLWKYREIFNCEGVFERVFLQDKEKHPPETGRSIVIADSSFMTVPRQRNSREENKIIRDGKGGSLWNDHPSKKRHKDIDARWTKKRNETFYGYKIHVLVCGITKLVTACYTTPANVHDAKAVDTLINELPEATSGADVPSETRMFLADAGYTGSRIEELVRAKNWNPAICLKGNAKNPLDGLKKNLNHAISSVRCRIEHVFAIMEGSMGGLTTRAIGLARAVGTAFAICWVYNACRFCRQFHQT